MISLETPFLATAVAFAVFCIVILVIADHMAGRIDSCTPRLHRTHDSASKTSQILIDRSTARGPMASLRLALRMAMTSLAFCAAVIGVEILNRLV